MHHSATARLPNMDSNTGSVRRYTDHHAGWASRPGTSPMTIARMSHPPMRSPTRVCDTRCSTITPGCNCLCIGRSARHRQLQCDAEPSLKTARASHTTAAKTTLRTRKTGRNALNVTGRAMPSTVGLTSPDKSASPRLDRDRVPDLLQASLPSRRHHDVLGDTHTVPVHRHDEAREK